MSFRPNIYGPTCPMGLITVAAAGTSVLLNDNWSPKFDSAPVTAAAPEQYAVACADIIINPVSTNAGDLYLVSRGGSKSDDSTVVLRIPRTTTNAPISLAASLGSNRFAPEAYALDADNNGDGAYVSGVIL